MTIATTENVASGVQVDQGQVLAYLGLNASDPKSQAVVAVARRYDLDPLLKHVIVIPKGGVYITRDGLLHVAHRSGQLDGIVVDQEPTLSEDGKEWVARVSVYRKDMGHPFTFPGRYPVQGMNREYAQEMSLKAAEAHALRRAFDVSGLPTLDEQRPEHESQPASGLAAALQTSDPEAGPDDPSSSVQPAPGSESPPITKAQLSKLNTVLTNLSMERDDALAFYGSIVGEAVASSKDLTKDQASAVIDALEALESGAVDVEVVEDEAQA